MCLRKQSSVGMGINVCHHQTNLQYTATCVRVRNGSAAGSAIKKHPEMCVCVCVFVHT